MIESIYNFRLLGPLLATAGQPDADELQAICRAGYQVVINLGLSDAPYALADEARIIAAHGLEYHHLPVSFEAPEIERFNAFRQLYRRLSDRKCFIHCAANKRVSCFVALYRVIELDWTPADTEREMHQVWHPNAAWSDFMARVLGSDSS